MPRGNNGLGLYEALDNLVSKLHDACPSEKANIRLACTLLQMEIIRFEAERKAEIDIIMQRVDKILGQDGSK